MFESNIKDLNEIIYQPSPLLAKRFSLVKSSGIIKRVSAQDVKTVSKKYENIKEYKINVELSQNGDKIKFPTKKAEVHNLLRLLNQDFYTGDLDGNHFLSSGLSSLKLIVSINYVDTRGLLLQKKNTCKFSVDYPLEVRKI